MFLRRFRASLEPLRSQPDYGENADGNPFARNASVNGESKGCLMAVCNDCDALIRECGEKIEAKNRILDEEYTENGISNHAHVTIQYGVCENSDKVREWCEKNVHPFTFKITGADVFKNEDSWVLVMRCNDESLKEVHKNFCRDIPHVDGEFPDYAPHMTICYMKPETPYDDVVKLCNEKLSGREVSVDKFEYSDENDNLNIIVLKEGENSEKEEE